MRLIFAAGLVCVTLVVDSTAVSSLGVSPSEQPARVSAAASPPVPLILLVTDKGAAVGGIALTAQ